MRKLRSKIHWMDFGGQRRSLNPSRKHVDIPVAQVEHLISTKRAFFSRDDTNPDHDDDEDDHEKDDDDLDEKVLVEVKKVRGKAKNWLENKSRLERNTSHTPFKVSCNKPDEQEKCVACSDDLNFNKPFLMCTECDAFLHIDGTGKNSCWWRFQNMSNFKK